MSRPWLWLGFFFVTVAVGAALWVERRKNAVDEPKAAAIEKQVDTNEIPGADSIERPVSSAGIGSPPPPASARNTSPSTASSSGAGSSNTPPPANVPPVGGPPDSYVPPPPNYDAVPPPVYPDSGYDPGNVGDIPGQPFDAVPPPDDAGGAVPPNPDGVPPEDF